MRTFDHAQRSCLARAARVINLAVLAKSGRPMANCRDAISENWYHALRTRAQRPSGLLMLRARHLSGPPLQAVGRISLWRCGVLSSVSAGAAVDRRCESVRRPVRPSPIQRRSARARRCSPCICRMSEPRGAASALGLQIELRRWRRASRSSSSSTSGTSARKSSTDELAVASRIHASAVWQTSSRVQCSAPATAAAGALVLEPSLSRREIFMTPLCAWS
jgi:hypothetical protein